MTDMTDRDYTRAPLLPCPFCGGTPEHNESHGWHGIGCQTAKCPAFRHALMFRTSEEAEAVWNRRASPAQADGTREG